MDGQPEILSSGPHARRPGPGRGIPVAVVALAALLLASLGVLAYMAVLLTHRDSTIHALRAAVQASERARSPAPVGGQDLPTDAGSALATFPVSSGGSFSVVAALIRPRPGAAPLTWIFVYGRHASPGQRYSLLDGTCGGEYVAPNDTAEGIADRNGDLTIVAPNLDLNPRSRNAWVLVYRWSDGLTLGGIRGPLVGGGSVPFRTIPPC